MVSFQRGKRVLQNLLSRPVILVRHVWFQVRHLVSVVFSLWWWGSTRGVVLSDFCGEKRIKFKKPLFFSSVFFRLKHKSPRQRKRDIIYLSSEEESKWERKWECEEGRSFCSICFFLSFFFFISKRRSDKAGAWCASLYLWLGASSSQFSSSSSVSFLTCEWCWWCEERQSSSFASNDFMPGKRRSARTPGWRVQGRKFDS